MRLRSLFIQESSEPRPQQGKAEARLASLPTHELVPWAERCLYGIGHNLSRYSGDPALRQDHLAEAVYDAEILLKIVTELQSRTAP